MDKRFPSKMWWFLHHTEFPKIFNSFAGLLKHTKLYFQKGEDDIATPKEGFGWEEIGYLN